MRIDKSYKSLILLGFYSFYFYLFLYISEKGGQKCGQKNLVAYAAKRHEKTAHPNL